MTSARKTSRKGRRLRSLTMGKRFPVSTEWRVELTYRFVPEFVTIDRKVIYPAAATVLGGRGFSHGSGAGFGDRDHDWRVKDRATAMRLARVLKIAATGLLPARLGIFTDKPIPSPRITVTPPPMVTLDVPVPKTEKRVASSKKPTRTVSKAARSRRRRGKAAARKRAPKSAAAVASSIARALPRARASKKPADGQSAPIANSAEPEAPSPA